MEGNFSEELKRLRKELECKLEELKKVVSSSIDEMKPRSLTSNDAPGWSFLRMFGFGRRGNE